jgi:hypothetical protein
MCGAHSDLHVIKGNASFCERGDFAQTDCCGSGTLRSKCLRQGPDGWTIKQSLRESQPHICHACVQPPIIYPSSSDLSRTLCIVLLLALSVQILAVCLTQSLRWHFWLGAGHATSLCQYQRPSAVVVELHMN